MRTPRGRQVTEKAYKHLGLTPLNDQSNLFSQILSTINSNTLLVKSIAKDLGFMSCGISKSGFLEDEADRFEKWLKNNYHGTMSYMQRNFDKRLDTTKLVELSLIHI